ncbi:MAG: hypothetical protein CSA45_02240 [Gammaproteobacteria bacterium]|nr:MAG: hypothetical protein CSA45_02240 [Gammaproteobacteria bacterium]
MKYPELIGKTIKLTALNDSHYEALQTIVVNNHDVYRYTTIGRTTADFARWFVLAQQHSAWTVIKLSDNQPIGSTRLYHLDTAVACATVGYTWYRPDCRGSGVNDEAKLLLLTYLFETMNINRVSFEINANNTASRRAVEKLSATLEGVLRQNRRTTAGDLADTCVYALFAEQWQKTKKQLQQKTGIL